MNIVNHHYEEKKQKISDINEHLETLYQYSKQCESVIECGVRDIVSSWAFIKGLSENNSEVKKLTSVDIISPGEINFVENICLEQHIEFKFIKGSDTDPSLNLPECDLLFIDTWHVYGHMKRELALLAPLAKKYIIMHDTTVDAIHGETVRMKYNVIQQMIYSGYPLEEILKGLQPAIDEFLESNPQWVIHTKYENNNGLTILKRLSI